MTCLLQLTQKELLMELIVANHVLLTCAKDVEASRQEKLAAREYLKSVVEEIERRKELQLEQQHAA